MKICIFFFFKKNPPHHINSIAVRDRVDKRVVVERGQVRVLGLDEDDGRRVVVGQVHGARQAVVEIREGNAILVADRVADDDLVDVVELVPVLVVDAVKARKRRQGKIRKHKIVDFFFVGKKNHDIFGRQHKLTSCRGTAARTWDRQARPGSRPKKGRGK